MKPKDQLVKGIEKLRKKHCSFAKPALIRAELCNQDSTDKCDICIFAFKILKALDSKEKGL